MPAFAITSALSLCGTVAAMAQTTVNGAVAALALGLAIAVACILWQLRQSRQRMAAWRRSLLTEQDLRARGEARSQTLQQDMSAQRTQLTALQRDCSSQRKKNHELQTELKALREQVREEKRLRLQAQTKRPAFGDGDEPTQGAPRPRQQMTAAALKTADATPVASPEQPKPAPPKPPVTPSNSETAILAALAAARVQLAAVAEKLANEQSGANQARTELKTLRRRFEDLRRIDIISRSKLELLEDKLLTVGRKYYDAISEVALLKGEVTPPRPAVLAPTPRSSAFGESEGVHNGDAPTHETDTTCMAEATEALSGVSVDTAAASIGADTTSSTVNQVRPARPAIHKRRSREQLKN